MATLKKLTNAQRLQWWRNTADFYRLAWAGQVKANGDAYRRLTIRVGFWKTVAVVSWGLALGAMVSWLAFLLARL